MSASQYEHIERIDLSGEDTFEVPSGVRTIGVISLYGSDTLLLPSTIERVEEIDLERSKRQLPNSVKEVLNLEIHFSDSSFGHAGVEKFGNVRLHQTDDFYFATGVREILSIDSATTSVHFPSTLRKIGNIHFHQEYNDEDSIDWPDGTVEVGDIRMEGPTKIRVPESVKKMGAAHVGRGATLEVSSNTVVDSFQVDDDGKLIRY